MNAYKAFQSLVKQYPIYVCEIVTVYSDTSLVKLLPSNSYSTVSGVGFAQGSRVYVQNGKITGLAPAGSVTTLSI